MGRQHGYPDFHEHLESLDKAGLLITIDEPFNKDTELHPLVRWQFRGGIREADRKAFKFTNVTDSLGRSYDMPVVAVLSVKEYATNALTMSVEQASDFARNMHAAVNTSAAMRG